MKSDLSGGDAEFAEELLRVLERLERLAVIRITSVVPLHSPFEVSQVEVLS